MEVDPQLLRRIDDRSLEMVQGLGRLEGHLIALDAKVNTNAQKCRERHTGVRRRLDTLSDEVEDTGQQELERIKRRAELPERVALWTLKILGGAMLVVAGGAIAKFLLHM